VSATFDNCTFENNYAYQGGVFYVQYSSVVTIRECTLRRNFAIIGGVAYVNNDGQIIIKDDTQIILNSAINTCFLFLINSQLYSQISHSFITQNAQEHSFILKTDFLKLTEGIEFLDYNYISEMKAISSKVQRTVEESTDTAIYAIKAKIQIYNFTAVEDNDSFFSGSTESVSSFVDFYYGKTSLSSRSFGIVSSTLTMENVHLDGISKLISSVFSVFNTMNKSKLHLKNVITTNTLCNMFYSIDSEIVFTDTLFKDVSNWDSFGMWFVSDGGTVAF